MYCVTLNLHDIKKLTSMSREYTMKVHLADFTITFWVKVLPPSFCYSLGSYLYLLFYTFYLVKIDSKISVSTFVTRKNRLFLSSRNISRNQVSAENIGIKVNITQLNAFYCYSATNSIINLSNK